MEKKEPLTSGHIFTDICRKLEESPFNPTHYFHEAQEEAVFFLGKFLKSQTSVSDQEIAAP